MMEAVRRAMAPLARKVSMMIGLAAVKLIQDQGGLQVVQADLLDGETHDGVQRFQNYGCTSVPHTGAEGVMLSVMGVRGQGVVVAVDDRRFRLKGLKTGEVALYDDLGQVVHLKRDGILIKSAAKVTVTAPAVTVNSDDIRLAGGDRPIARVGDLVSEGVIVTGSDKARCG